MKNLVFSLGVFSLCLFMPGGVSEAATCYGTGCNNLDPNVTGCSSGAYVVGSAAFTDGSVYLLYSPACNTVYSAAYNQKGRVGTLHTGLSARTCPYQGCNNTTARSTTGTYVHSSMWVPTGDAVLIASSWAYLEPYYPRDFRYNMGGATWYR